MTPIARAIPGLMERPDGNNVSMDRESLLMAETQLQFNIGVQLIRNQFQQIMTAINEEGYGEVVLTPAQILDFSEAEGTVTWELSTYRSSLRDWPDVWITPWEQNITLPFDSGEHPFLGGPATLLEFPEIAHLDVVYLEGLAGDYYEEQPSEVARYRYEFERLSVRALDNDSSLELIKGLRKS